MSVLAAAEHEAVLRHVAALSTHGMPLGQSLPLIVEQLPAGPTRDKIAAVSAALARGEVLADDQDALLTLLARGEAAGPKALAEAVRAYDLFERARQSAQTGLSYVTLLSGLGCFFAAVTNVALVHLWRDLGQLSELPGASHLLLTVLPLAAAACCFIFVSLLFLRDRLKEWVPGARAFESAARLRLYGAGLEAGVPAPTALRWLDPRASAGLEDARNLRLDPLELQLIRYCTAQGGPADAARALAADREAEGGRLFQSFVAYGSPAVFGFIVVAVLGIAGGAYLPLFRIAGVIK